LNVTELVQIGLQASQHIPTQGAQARRPPWLKVKVTHSQTYAEVGELLSGLGLNTVCQEARCPNIWECWGQHRTATFMILGDVCTRACRYCSVTSGKPPSLPDPKEPTHVAEAVSRLGLAHAVVTSVDRDDIDDFGSTHFAHTIAAIQDRCPDCTIEVLIPDFAGSVEALERVLEAQPDVLDHNIETVPRLYRTMRPKGDYNRALNIMRHTRDFRAQHQIPMTIKSGLMVGLGERVEEVISVMRDLHAAGCEIITIGQYLNPTRKHAPISRFYTPEEFEKLRVVAQDIGFAHCESGPLVRSSYHAHEHVKASK
jgi:lipoyl synthase